MISRRRKKFINLSMRTILQYFFMRTSEHDIESDRGEAAISACCPPQLFHKQQLDAALRLKLATRRTATRKLIDAQENSSGGEDGSRASGRRRVLFTWITRAPYPDAASPSFSSYDLVLGGDKTRPCVEAPGQPF